MRYIILYLAFGGFLMAIVAGGIKKECGATMSITEFALSSAVWPSVIAGAITYRINFGSEQQSICTKTSVK